jgi:hypothetical protein
MKSIRYYVGTCLGCNNLVLLKVKYAEFEKECCLEPKNLKILRIFNDEEEAKNYIKLYSKEEQA